MRRLKPFIQLLFPVLILSGFTTITNKQKDDDRIISYVVNPKEKDLQLYWKDDKGQILGSIQHLKTFVEGKHRSLVFAMNGGMYTKAQTPQGLFIQNKKTLSPLDTSSGSGNFYLKPNGVFYITSENIPVVCSTVDFANNGQVKFATQSGPMLVIDGKIHQAFQEGSLNLNIRNGVGILPDNKVVFAMSKEKINFYDFALYFKKLGCKNALYLDGFVSRMYLPEQNWVQLDGEFGVMIGVSSK